MNHTVISNAVERLEQNLPLRGNQLKLPGELRQFHKNILWYYLEFNCAPRSGDIECPGDWAVAIRRLAKDKIIVTDDKDNITGAYPFTSEIRDFQVASEYGKVNAMCAFDALAISSMFKLSTRIESHCRLSGDPIVIEQDDSQIRQLEPNAKVLAAINWSAQDASKTCSVSLCTEMVFIIGESEARDWYLEDRENRQLFCLDDAHQLITSIFLP